MASKMFKDAWNLIVGLFVKRYDVTVWFDGETIVGPSGTTTSNRQPKTYHCKRIVKLSPKHIKLVDVDDNKIEIKTVHQVGYDIIQKKYPPAS